MLPFRSLFSLVSVLAMCVASAAHAQSGTATQAGGDDAGVAGRPLTLEEEMAAMRAGEPAPANSPTPAAPAPSAAAATAPRTSTAGTTETDLRDDQALFREEVGAESARSGLEPRELPDTDYFFVGLSFRGVLVPDFIQRIFATYEGSSAMNVGFGGYFNWRRNNFNVQAEFNYISMWNEGYYRGLNAPALDMEYIESRLGLLMGNVLFSWAFPFTDWIALEVGVGIGAGGMTGSLRRQEAAPTGGGFTPCAGPGQPPGGGCDSRGDGGVYQVTDGTSNPFRFGDDGVPPVFLWLDIPRVAVRIKPIRNLQIRGEAGYNLYGFNFGVNAGYGF